VPTSIAYVFQKANGSMHPVCAGSASVAADENLRMALSSCRRTMVV
jgi:hypothetical protein